MKYVIFDFDGTLADSKKVMVSAWNQLAEKYHFKAIKLDELEAMKKLSIRERSKLLNFPMYKMPIVIPQLYQLYRHAIQDVDLFEGVKELLIGLEKKGFKIAIISSNSEDIIKDFLSRNRIESVQHVLCSSRIFGKDRLIAKFLKANRVETSEVIYVGDEHRDIVACKKSGVKIIWVGWGYDAIEVIQAEKPDYMVNSPNEILQLMENHR